MVCSFSWNSDHFDLFLNEDNHFSHIFDKFDLNLMHFFGFKLKYQFHFKRIELRTNHYRSICIIALKMCRLRSLDKKLTFHSELSVVNRLNITCFNQNRDFIEFRRILCHFGWIHIWIIETLGIRKSHFRIQLTSYLK